MKKILWIILSFFLALPSQAAAQQFLNPLSEEGGSLSPQTIIGRLVQAFLSITGVIAMVYIIIGGMRIIFAAGNEEQVKRGKMTLLWAVLGLIIAFGGFIVVNTILEQTGFLVGQEGAAPSAGPSIQGPQQGAPSPESLPAPLPGQSVPVPGF